MILSFDEAGALLDEMAEEFPPEFYDELNGGIALLPEAKEDPEGEHGELYIMGEYCKSSAASLTYGDDEDNANMTRSALLLLDQVVSKQAGVQLDLTRVYGTGHSAGSRTVQTLTHNSEAYYFAAVSSTSFPNTEFTADSMMPSYLLAGQADISEPDRGRDLVKDPWNTAADSAI